MARAPKLPQIDAEQRFLAQVAWAYYVEGLTQEKVAEKLGATRLLAQSAGDLKTQIETFLHKVKAA